MAMIQGSLTYLRRVLLVLMHMLLRRRPAVEGRRKLLMRCSGRCWQSGGVELVPLLWRESAVERRSMLIGRAVEHDAEKVDAGHVVRSSSLVG